MKTENSRKVRVALCITELFIGGAEKALTELATRLDRRRFDPTVYVLRSRNYHNGKTTFIPVLEKEGIPVRFLNIAGPFDLLPAVRRLKRELKTQKTDVFQSFMFHANLLGRIAAWRAGVPLILSGIRVSEREHRIHPILDRLTSSMVDRYVCVSQSAADFTEKVGKIPTKKIIVIPNAIAPPDLEPATDLFAGAESEKKIVFVGRLTRQKGLDWLLSTAPSWLRESWADGWSLWLVGEGREEKTLRQTVGGLPSFMASKIHFAGWRPNIPAILAASDLLILPSRYEGMPNVLLEASAVSLPVLSSRCDGVEEILGGQTADQTFDFGDTEGFLLKLRRLLENDTLRKDLGEENRRRVLSEFSVGKMVDRYQELWQTSPPPAVLE